MKARPSTRKNSSRTSRTTPRAVVLAEPRMDATATHDQIARKAYELWIARGGDAESNWYEAERQLSVQGSQ